MIANTLQVEWRWVAVSESENVERCQRLRELLLRGARRLSQSASPATGLKVSLSKAPSKSDFPSVFGSGLEPTTTPK